MEKIDVDLNSLFNLSYNFENLKLLLTTINKNQSLFERKIKEVEDKLNNINLKPPEQIPEQIPKEIVEKPQEIFNLKINRELQKSKTRRIPTFNDDLNKKMNELDYKLKLLYNFIPKFPDDKTRTLNNILDEQQISLENNSTDIKEMKAKIDNMKQTVDELKLKMNEMDIYDVIKDIQFSGGDIEASKILIQSLDKKTEARFKFLEEKIKDDEQIAQKLKNEIINLKNNSTIQKNNLTIMREQLIKMQNEIDSNKRNSLEKIKNNENEIEALKEREIKNLESINNQFQNITMNLYDNSNKNEDKDNMNVNKDNEEIKEEIKEEPDTKKTEKDIIQDMKKENSSTEKDKSEERDKMDSSMPKIDEENLVTKSEFNEYKAATQKKLNNFERRFQALNSQIKTDSLQKEIFAIKSELNKKKPSAQEWYDLTVQVQQSSAFYDRIKEENSNIQEEFKKIKDSVSTLLKNYEYVILKTTSNNTPNNLANITDKEKLTMLTKLSDYVEISVFNEYIKEQTKFSEKIKKEIDSYRHFYNEIIETLKKAASVQDLKSLEEYLLDLFDEFKDRTNKFYPKKSEINKNFKALELQIRQLYDYIIKKDENTENWLLAKKPIGGFSCASCESYLGDLKENNEKILWNQLPERDILTTNTNRIGNGFSRILNLVNVSGDNNSNKKDNNPNSPNSILKPDYGSFKNELFLQRKNTEGDDENNFSDNKKIMNITTLKNDDEPKNIFKEYSGNNTKTNMTSKPRITFLQDEKLRLTTSDNNNLFKEMKTQKKKNGLPPINKDESNVRNANFSSLFEEMKDYKDKNSVPKVMKIVRKKNK